MERQGAHGRRCILGGIALAGAGLLFGAGCAAGPDPAPDGPDPGEAPAVHIGGAYTADGGVTVLPAPAMKSYGGPILANAQITTLSWASDTADWASFYTRVAAGGSMGWLAEYGINGFQVVQHVPVYQADASSPYRQFGVTGACDAYDVDCRAQGEITRLIDIGTIPANNASSYYSIDLGLANSQMICEGSKLGGGWHTSFLRNGLDACSQQRFQNPNFDQVGQVAWTLWGQAQLLGNTGSYPYTGKLCGAGNCLGTIAQTITVPDCDTAGMTFNLAIAKDPSTTTTAEFAVEVHDGADWTTLFDVTKDFVDAPLNLGGLWSQYMVSLAPFRGKTVSIVFAGDTYDTDTTAFYVDTVATGSTVFYGTAVEASRPSCTLGSMTDPGLEATKIHELMEGMTDPMGIAIVPGDTTSPTAMPSSTGWRAQYTGDGAAQGEIPDICDEATNWAVVDGASQDWVTFGWSALYNDCRMTCSVVPSEHLPSGTFESPPSGWTVQPTGATLFGMNANKANHGTGYAFLGNLSQVQTLTSPRVLVPNDACRSPGLWFSLNMTTAGGGTGTSNHLALTITDTDDGSKTATVVTFSGADGTGGYQPYWVDLSGFKGDHVRLQFAATDSGMHLTTFYLDDVSIK